VDGNTEKVAKRAPWIFRHMRQWQWYVLLAVPLSLYRTAPQRQPPVISDEVESVVVPAVAAAVAAAGRCVVAARRARPHANAAAAPAMALLLLLRVSIAAFALG
jgi:hypothetical protein